MSKPRQPQITKVHCDGPDRHTHFIDAYRATAMDGERCNATPSCSGRIRLNAPIAEVKEPLSREHAAHATLAALFVPLGLVLTVYLSFRSREAPATASSVPEAVAPVESVESDPSLSTEVLPPAERSVEPITPSSDDLASSTQLEPTIESSPLTVAWESLVCNWKDPRVYLVVLGLLFAAASRQPRVALFGLAGAAIMTVLGVMLSNWFMGQIRNGAADTLGVGMILEHADQSALWGCVLGFFAGGIQFLRLPRKARSQASRPIRRR